MRFWPRARASKPPGIFRQSALDHSQSLDPFWQSLAITIEWCSARADASRPRESLRDTHTRPRVLEPNYFSVGDDVLRLQGRRESGRPRQLGSGRLLLYFPDEEGTDGMSEAETEGFFDLHDAPPWDTWVAMLEDAAAGSRGPHLVAWIPAVFFARAQAGIDVNALDDIAWLDDCDVALRAILAREFANTSS
jgi:hypothetical protein